MKLSYFACIELNSSQRGGKKGGLDLSSAEKQQQQQQQSWERKGIRGGEERASN